MNQAVCCCLIYLLLVASNLNGQDWLRFRGPAGSGVSSRDSQALPSEWSPGKNVAWKSELPGPGASSPIIVGNKVFVTCYSGYGIDRKLPGDIENLKRHLVCFDFETGGKLWQKDVKAALPEDLYDKSGVSSHGYASHTPVSDGTHVFCFFGKSGVHAFDLDGKELWQADAGNGSDPPRWGSSSSPIVHESVLIVTASAESQSIIGFEKSSGKKVWQYQSAGLDGAWGTPAMVETAAGQKDVVLLVAGEIWGLDPASGKIRWKTRATDSQHAYTSIISEGNRVFAFAGSGGGGIAMDLVDEGTKPIWKSNVFATYASPVKHQNRIYVISKGIFSVVDASTGKRINQFRLKGARQMGNARFGSLDYASPVVVGDRLFWLNASGQTFVFQLGEDITQLAVNELTTESEVFWGSPAVKQGRMFIRSSRFLYCIADQNQSDQ